MLIDIHNHIIETDEIDRIYPIEIIDDRPSKNEIRYKIKFQLKTSKQEIIASAYLSKLQNTGSEEENANTLLGIALAFKKELCKYMMESKSYNYTFIQQDIPKLQIIYPEKIIPDKKLVENPKSISEIAEE